MTHNAATPKRLMRLGARLMLGAIVVAMVTAPGTGVPANAAPGGTDHHVYLPIVKGLYVSLANGSFEADTVVGLPAHPHCRYDGFTDGRGNQHPAGWTFYSPDTGEVMPFPTKMQEGSIVPAISGGQGEYIHKCQWQYPKNEYPGMPEALILDGYWSYKAFSDHIPQALQLTQVITGVPGAQVQVTGYILGETHDQPSGSNTKLEDDHFVASVQLGGVADTRFYATMIQRHDVAGNTRAWNRFSVAATFPANGLLTLTVITQQNWCCLTDFFLDDFRAAYVAE
jgi:hypothetical protein